MAAKTLIVARKVWVSKGLSKPVKSKTGWTKSLVGRMDLSSPEEQRESAGISGLDRDCCGRDVVEAEEEEEEEEREASGWKE